MKPTHEGVSVDAFVMAQKAFIIEIPNIDGQGIYQAQNASKARYIAYLQAKDAGFNIRLIDIIVHRAKKYDNYNIGHNGKAIEYIEYYAP